MLALHTTHFLKPLSLACSLLCLFSQFTNCHHGTCVCACAGYGCGSSPGSGSAGSKLQPSHWPRCVVCAEALWLVTGPSRCHPCAGIYDMTGPASDGKKLLLDSKCVTESDSISPLPEQSTLWAMQTPSKLVAAFTFVNVLVHSSLATPPLAHALSLSRSMPVWAPRPSRLQSLRSSQYVKEGGQHCWDTRHDTHTHTHKSRRHYTRTDHLWRSVHGRERGYQWHPHPLDARWLPAVCPL